MTKQRPNIIFMLNDNQAYYRYGWDGGLMPARPHFDRLAREGIDFQRAYSACPLCTPARRSMITGLLPHNHGFLTLEEDENSEEHDEGIVFDRLAEQGYRNYYYGKWHTGPGTAADLGCEGVSYPGYGNPYIWPEYEAYCKARGMEIASFDVEHVVWEPVAPEKPSPGPGYRCEMDRHPRELFHRQPGLRKAEGAGRQRRRAPVLLPRELLRSPRAVPGQPRVSGHV